MSLARIVAQDGACTALGVRPLGTEFAMFAEKTSVLLNPETMAIFTLAFASLKNN
jgi:hypothetical protein